MFSTLDEIDEFLTVCRDGNDPWQLELCMLNENETNNLLTKYLSIRHPGEVNGNIDRVRRVNTILNSSRELSRPLFIALLVNHWIRFKDEEILTTTSIHKAIVDDWIERENKRGHDHFNAEKKREWLNWLAAWLEVEPGRSARLDRSFIPSEICHFFDYTDAEKFEKEIAHEVRVSSFLDSNPDGSYRFSYTSFHTYCYADSIVESLKTGRRSRFGRRCLSSKTQLISFLEFVGEIMHSLTPQNSALVRKNLRRWLKQSSRGSLIERSLPRDSDVEEAKYARLGMDQFVSANALILLTFVNKGDISGEDLSSICITDCELTPRNLGLPAITLEGADLSCSYISRVDCSLANLTNVSWDHCWLHDVTLPKACYTTLAKAEVIVTQSPKTSLKPAVPKQLLQKSQQTIRDLTPDGMIYLPGDRYSIGDAGPSERLCYDRPQFAAVLDPVFISERLITNRQFRDFLRTEEGGKKWANIEVIREKFNVPWYLHHWKEADPDEAIGFVNYPVSVDYCDSKMGRLPTEAELEALFKEGLVEPWAEIGEWTLDFFSRDYTHLIRGSGQVLNPYTDEIFPLLDHRDSDKLKRRYSRERPRVIRGRPEQKGKGMTYRETVEATNVNPDVGFRLVLEPWIVLAQATKTVVRAAPRARRTQKGTWPFIKKRNSCYDTFGLTLLPNRTKSNGTPHHSSHCLHCSHPLRTPNDAVRGILC